VFFLPLLNPKFKFMLIGEIVGIIFLALAIGGPIFMYITMPEKMKSDDNIIILSAAATLCVIIGFILVTEY